MLPALDVYSFGVIVEECFLRQDPRRGSHDACNDLKKQPDTLYSKPMARGRRSSLAVNIPPYVAVIVSRCQHKDVTKRPEFLDVQRLLKQLGETSVGKAFLRRGVEGRRQDRVLQQVS